MIIHKFSGGDEQAMENNDETEGYSQILWPGLGSGSRFNLGYDARTMRRDSFVPYCDFCEKFVKNRMSVEDFHETILTVITQLYYSRFSTRQDIRDLCKRFDLPYANSCALCEVFIQGRVSPQRFYEALSRAAGHKHEDGSTWGCLTLIVVVIGVVLYWLLH